MDPRSFPGCTVLEFACILHEEANDKHAMVLGDFNGTPMLACPGVSPYEMIKNWAIMRAEQQSVA